MAACKVFFVVALVSVALVQINGKPATDGKPATSDTALGDKIQAALKEVSKMYDENVGKGSEFATAAKTNLNAVTEGLKSELAVFVKLIEGKAEPSDLTKESAKQFKTAMDSMSASIPKDFNIKQVNEKTEQMIKYIVDHSNDLMKKAQGNVDFQKEIKDAATKSLDMVVTGVQKLEKQITGDKKD